MLTQQLLKEYFHYNPLTGVFIWIKRSGLTTMIGDIAGTLDKCNYVVIRFRGISYKAHRLAFLYMNGVFPEKQVDHINHIRSDNRWENLRPATNSENQKNRKLGKNNVSGKSGVFWVKEEKKWRAMIRVDNVRHSLGFFPSFEEAVEARRQAEIKFDFHSNHGL